MGVAVLSLVSLVAFAAPAGNINNTLAVLPIVSPASAASQSDVFRAVGQATRRRLGVQLLSIEEVFVANQEGLVSRVRDCGPDVQCIANRMRRFRARLGLVIVYDRSISPAILGLQLVDTDAGQLVDQTLDEIDDGGPPFAMIARRTGELLEKAGYVEAGRLTVDVDPAAAQVRLQSGVEPDLGSPHVFTLPPGAYRIIAEQPGYAPAQAAVRIDGGRDTRISLRLEAQTSVWASPWLWVAVGVVVLGAVTAGAVVASQPDPRVCFSFEGRSCD